MELSTLTKLRTSTTRRRDLWTKVNCGGTQSVRRAPPIHEGLIFSRKGLTSTRRGYSEFLLRLTRKSEALVHGRKTKNADRKGSEIAHLNSNIGAHISIDRDARSPCSFDPHKPTPSVAHQHIKYSTFPHSCLQGIIEGGLSTILSCRLCTTPKRRNPSFFGTVSATINDV